MLEMMNLLSRAPVLSWFQVDHGRSFPILVQTEIWVGRSRAGGLDSTCLIWLPWCLDESYSPETRGRLSRQDLIAWDRTLANPHSSWTNPKFSSVEARGAPTIYSNLNSNFSRKLNTLGIVYSHYDFYLNLFRFQLQWQFWSRTKCTLQGTVKQWLSFWSLRMALLGKSVL